MRTWDWLGAVVAMPMLCIGGALAQTWPDSPRGGAQYSYSCTGSSDTTNIQESLNAAHRDGGGTVALSGNCSMSSTDPYLVIYSNTRLTGGGTATITDNPFPWRPTLVNEQLTQTVKRSFTCTTFTINSKTPTCAGANLTSDDIGQSIQIEGGLGATPTLAGIPVASSDSFTMIMGISSSTVPILSDPIPAVVSNANTYIRDRDQNIKVDGITFIEQGPNVTDTSGAALDFVTLNGLQLKNLQVCDVSCTTRPSNIRQGSKLIAIQDASNFTLDRNVLVSWFELQDGVDIHGPYQDCVISNQLGTTGDNNIAFASWGGGLGASAGVGKRCKVVNSVISGGYNTIMIGGPDGGYEIPQNDITIQNVSLPAGGGGFQLRVGSTNNIVVDGWSGSTYSDDRFEGNISVGDSSGRYGVSVTNLVVKRQQVSTVAGVNVVAVGPNSTVTNLFIDDARPDLDGGYLLATAPGSTVTNLCTNDENSSDFDLLGTVTNGSSAFHDMNNHTCAGPPSVHPFRAE